MRSLRAQIGCASVGKLRCARNRFFGLLVLAFSCLNAAATPKITQPMRTFKNPQCGVTFTYPSTFRADLMGTNEIPDNFHEKFGQCVIFLYHASDVKPNLDGISPIKIDIVKAPLVMTLENDLNWSRSEEGNDKSWVVEGFASGYGEIIERRAISRISATYSLNCGKDRTPDGTIMCDAFAGAVSNEKLTISVYSSLSGETDLTSNLLQSIRFLPQSRLEKRSSLFESKPK